MRLDSDTLRPVIISMGLYLILAHGLPNMKPTGIKVVDDVIAMMIANKGSVLPGVLTTGAIVFATNEFNKTF